MLPPSRHLGELFRPVSAWADGDARDEAVYLLGRGTRSEDISASRNVRVSRSSAPSALPASSGWHCTNVCRLASRARPSFTKRRASRGHHAGPALKRRGTLLSHRQSLLLLPHHPQERVRRLYRRCDRLPLPLDLPPKLIFPTTSSVITCSWIQPRTAASTSSFRPSHRVCTGPPLAMVRAHVHLARRLPRPPVHHIDPAPALPAPREPRQL